MADPVVFAGTVEWSGENPGISLKEKPEGPFVVLASFFRVVLSPHGRGHALVLLQSPDDAGARAERANYCLHDNEPLARYLVTEFVSHFGAYKGKAGLQRLVYRQLDLVEASGDPASTYSERVRAGDLDVRLTWSGLGGPFCFALPPDKSATGKHHMPSSLCRMPRCLGERERAYPFWQTGTARDCWPHHNDGDAGVLRDMDPRQLGVRQARKAGDWCGASLCQARASDRSFTASDALSVGGIEPAHHDYARSCDRPKVWDRSKQEDAEARRPDELHVCERGQHGSIGISERDHDQPVTRCSSAANQHPECDRTPVKRHPDERDQDR